ncbi:gibberellin-regulated protein 14-like [Cryptomeria japonica]|uniref:gibberellin-regulated protein 14-like n=1 Tax=Cryptomeria japonica TaxID=3369 RepID=UPI0027DA5C7E|nr:gibberellin-regulated protein 14-like [Cryptomeria japonica]
MAAPSIAKRRAPILLKFMARPPFELPIMADIPHPSRYKKGKHSYHVFLSPLAPSSQPTSTPSIPPTTTPVKQGQALVVVHVVPLRDASPVSSTGTSPVVTSAALSAPPISPPLQHPSFPGVLHPTTVDRRPDTPITCKRKFDQGPVPTF